MSLMKTKEEKNMATTGPIPFTILDFITVADTNFFNRREQSPRYHEIYRIFQNKEYPFNDKDIDEYQNIRRSRIHTLASHSMLFPYNDVERWCFTYLQKETTAIINEFNFFFTSLNPVDIMIIYKTPQLIVSLDESFSENFRVENEDFEDLIED